MTNETIIQAFEQPNFPGIPADLKIEDTVIYTKDNHLVPTDNPFAYGAGYTVRNITAEGIVVNIASELHAMKHGDYAIL